VLLGRRRRLFDVLPSQEVVGLIDAPEAIHIRYRAVAEPVGQRPVGCGWSG